MDDTLDPQSLAELRREVEELKARLQSDTGAIPDPRPRPAPDLTGYGGVSVNGEAISYDSTFDGGGTADDSIIGVRGAFSVGGRPAIGRVAVSHFEVLPDV